MNKFDMGIRVITKPHDVTIRTKGCKHCSYACQFLAVNGFVTVCKLFNIPLDQLCGMFMRSKQCIDEFGKGS